MVLLVEGSLRFFFQEIHYDSSFKEILAIKHGIENFGFYVRPCHFKIEMDMVSFPKMLNFKQKVISNSQLHRWSNWFSQFSFTVIHIKGKSNIIADFFSRNHPSNPSLMMFSSISMSYQNPPEHFLYSLAMGKGKFGKK